ncbi:MAG: UDP-glucose/GDP-mannose dehydrogenase family protein [Candidatus Eisenbacteria bacterium]|nr:UDP-glucose/GDP-mannose dehydrogenase family protein [Candidatus Eisenbacteria bacterium]
MKVSVFGLGYVGCVTSACLAKIGHQVIGVDVNPYKVDCINSMRSPILETGLEEMIRKMVQTRRLSATLDWKDAARRSNVSLVCVGTPTSENGLINLSAVRRVVRSIGSAIAHKNSFHVVILRSTMLPGTSREVISILEQSSRKKHGKGFGFVFNPEFLREGAAISDFLKPEVTVVGNEDGKSLKVVEQLYKPLDAPIVSISIEAAEMLKYVNNAYHALKICFANEIGNICVKEGLDSHEVMRIFCMDKKLNISSWYLKPGFAYGGSCLPKDLRAIVHRSKEHRLKSPLLESIIESNEMQIQLAMSLIEKTKKKKVGILGLSFKAETDDMRESPIVKVLEVLVGKGYRVLVHDKNIDLKKLLGANRKFLEKEVPYLPSIMCSTMEEVVKRSDVIVLANENPDFKKVVELIDKNQILIDLVRMLREDQVTRGKYFGLT